MNKLRFLALCLAPFAFAAVAGVAADTSSPAKAAEGFYAVYSTFHPSDGIPNAADRAKYAPFISAALDKLLADGNAAERRFNKANKDSPPLIEGDLFSSMFEGATSYKVGACKLSGGEASCVVDLVYDDHKDAPTRWTDTVYLTQSKAGWRVDDIGYGGNWDFGNKGRLSATVRQAISDSGG
ncbi:MAG: hypothetical protein WCA78_15215 [Rhizomicrobium sp.]